MIPERPLPSDLSAYADIIPDFSALQALQDRPLPTCIWVNTLKISPDRLYTLMRALGYQLQPVAWHPAAFLLEDAPRIGQIWPYYAGLYQVQEAVSMMAGYFLGAKPHERVLDLCAAPGNKTAQLAVAMQNTGTLIANDKSYGRLRALGQIMKRLGLINISSSVYDGTAYPQLNDFFDRVLVDAPCSCQGTYRKGRHKKVEVHRGRSLKMADTQYALLERAFSVTRPGGTILYSTCTFAPEENEAVISRFKYQHGDHIQVLPLAMPKIVYSPGCAAWQGEVFHPDVVHTRRLWPHQNNTGGFYLALLRKANKESCQNKQATQSLPVCNTVVHEAKRALKARFAMTDDEKYLWHTKSRRGVYLTAADHVLPTGLAVDATGLFAFKHKIRFPKLTTGAAMFLAPYFAKNTLAFSDAQMTQYYQREPAILDASQVNLLSDQGYVLVTYKGCALGLGMYYPSSDSRPATVVSLFPKYLLG